MELVVDWNAVCLVCLQEGEMRSIFEKDEKNYTISDKIMQCSSIEIKKGMNLPEQICSKCYEDLKIAYRFRTNCESSNMVLKSFVNINSNVIDVDIKSSNGQIFKYKPPCGLNVKRIKVAPRFLVKEDKEQEQSDNDDEDTLPEKLEDTSNDNTTINDNIQDSYEDANDDNINDSENNDDEEKLRKTTDFELYELKLIEESKDNEKDSESMDKTIETIFFEEDNDEMPIQNKEIKKTVKMNTRSQSSKTKATTSKITNATTSNSKPRKRGRPNTRMIKTDEDITPDNISTMVTKLTSVAYVKKRKNDAKPLKICEICGNGYKYQHALDSHMRRHRNEKPFACEFCDRAFVANVELRRHMRVHTGQKPYGCQYCNRCFSDFGSRIKHERTHTGERPYECSTCGKSFAYSHVLSVHVLTHTGEKKFRCEVCGKGFTKKIYLQGHMNHHFADEKLKKEPKTHEIIHEIQILPEKSEEIIDLQIENDAIEHKIEYDQDDD